MSQEWITINAFRLHLPLKYPLETTGKSKVADYISLCLYIFMTDLAVCV